MIESQQEDLHRAQAEERHRQDHQLLHEQLLKQNWDLREAHERSLNEIEELKRFQGSTFDTIARRKLVEDQNTILELTGKIQELQKEIKCMDDSRDFQDAESKQLQKRCRKKQYENIHDRFIRDMSFRKTMIELGRSEEVILEMDRLASEDHSHIATEEEIDVYRGNWWIRSNLVNSDTMLTRHRPHFKKALSTLYRLKKTEDNAHYENWSQSSS